MGKPVKVLMFYLGALFLSSLLLTWLRLSVIYIPFNNDKIEIKTIMLVTIAGGIIALSKTVSPRALKIFIIIYACLWVLRFIILYLALHIKEINFFGKVFHVDLIAPSYYSTVSRLGTPLPFVIFWLINHLFSTNRLLQKEELDKPGA